jgi:hypothetical protein
METVVLISYEVSRILPIIGPSTYIFGVVTGLQTEEHSERWRCKLSRVRSLNKIMHVYTGQSTTSKCPGEQTSLQGRINRQSLKLKMLIQLWVKLALILREFQMSCLTIRVHSHGHILMDNTQRSLHEV